MTRAKYLADRANELYQEKIDMLKSLGIDVEFRVMLQVGPDEGKLVLEQLRAMFIAGFFHGMDEAKDDSE